MSKLDVYRLISYFDDWSSRMFYNYLFILQLFKFNRFCITIIFFIILLLISINNFRLFFIIIF